MELSWQPAWTGGGRIATGPTRMPDRSPRLRRDVATASVPDTQPRGGGPSKQQPAAGARARRTTKGLDQQMYFLLYIYKTTRVQKVSSQTLFFFCLFVSEGVYYANFFSSHNCSKQSLGQTDGAGAGGRGAREEPSGYNQTFVKPVCLPAAWSTAPQRKPKET